jgi:hypothetical protein
MQVPGELVGQKTRFRKQGSAHQAAQGLVSAMPCRMEFRIESSHAGQIKKVCIWNPAGELVVG